MSTDWGFYCETCQEDAIIDECRQPAACHRILLCRNSISSLLHEVQAYSCSLEDPFYFGYKEPPSLELWNYRVPLDFFEKHRGHPVIVVNEYYSYTKDDKNKYRPQLPLPEEKKP